MAESAIALIERKLGKDASRLWSPLNQLGLWQWQMGAYADAERTLERALSVLKGETNDLRAANIYNNLALVYHNQHRLDDALVALEKAAHSIRSLPDDHPLWARHYVNVSQVRARLGDTKEALEAADLAEQRHRKLLEDAWFPDDPNRVIELAQTQEAARLHLDLLDRVIAREPRAMARAFEVAQQLEVGLAASAVRQLSERQAANTDELAAMRRRRQELRASREKLLEELMPQGSGAVPADLRARLQAIDDEKASIESKLARLDPRGLAFEKLTPLSLRDAQALLRPHEALVLLSTVDDCTRVWLVRRDVVRQLRVPLGQKALEKHVTSLRGGLESSKEDAITSRAPSFDLGLAHQLYRDLLEPIEQDLVGVTHLMSVAQGPLQKLPLAVLVTREPVAGESYAQAAWLIRRHALSTLPSVGSLQQLRGTPPSRRAAERTLAFAGFGDPVLPDVAARATRGRDSLARVPSTARELRSMASSVSGDTRLWLGAEATESQLRELSRTGELARARIVAFATHAVLPGRDFTEPGLLLTLPSDTRGSEDDGFLSSQEASGLELDADLVILAGCNTAGRGTARDEVLAGLGQAFFFAGARSLLVSHWSADDDATMELMARFMDRHAGSDGVAEALRQAQLDMLDASFTETWVARLLRQTDPSYYTAPFFWAPFVVAGDGQVTR